MNRRGLTSSIMPFGIGTAVVASRAPAPERQIRASIDVPAGVWDVWRLG